MVKSFDKSSVRGIILDYGATIDSNGVHWAEIIWDGYLNSSLEIPKEDFRDAYVFAERAMAKNKIIFPEDDFRVLMQKKIDLQFFRLLSLGYELDTNKSLEIARYCYRKAKESVEIAKPILMKLSENYTLVLVSNFYGNIESVLKDFDILFLFPTIVESAVVGVRKPDPQIFQLGVDSLGLNTSEVLVVGDSYKKDIEPATTIGCQAIWLKGKGWDALEDAVDFDNIILSFEELKALFDI